MHLLSGAIESAPEQDTSAPPPPSDPDLAARVATLERELEALRREVAALRPPPTA
jgi:uncharacterized protein YceH (UPF0502 family)